MLQAFLTSLNVPTFFNDTSFRNALIANNFRGFIQFQLMPGECLLRNPCLLHISPLLNNITVVEVFRRTSNGWGGL